MARNWLMCAGASLIRIKDSRTASPQMAGMTLHAKIPVERESSLDHVLRSALGIRTGTPLAGSLKALATPMVLRRGEIAQIAADGTRLVAVASGATKLVGYASRDREQIVAFHFDGDIVPIPADREHVYRLCALTETRLFAFPAQALVDCLEHHPKALRKLFDRTQTALFRCRDKALGLGRKSAQERLASFLLTMAERMNACEGARCVLDLPMSRRDIGDSLGLTIETVSRQIGELRALGALDTQGRSRVVLHDREALGRLAGHV